MCVLEPVHPTILAVQFIGVSVRESTCNAAVVALGTARAVEVRDVLVADIAEPMAISESSVGVEVWIIYQWILSLSSNNPSAMLCTGASPHRS